MLLALAVILAALAENGYVFYRGAKYGIQALEQKLAEFNDELNKTLTDLEFRGELEIHKELGLVAAWFKSKFNR